MSKAISLDCVVPHYSLPRPIDWQTQFGRKAPLVLEIGSGHGDFILRQAQEDPEADFIGIEQEWERVKTSLRKIKLARSFSGKDCVGRNIRIVHIDATVALARLFLPQMIHQVFCLFPCPWPKKKHVKHRLFSLEFLRLVNSRLVLGGQVILVTDAKAYFSWVLEQLPDTGFSFEKRTVPPRRGTKYERKWSAKGQADFFELALIKEKHFEIPFKEDVALRVFLGAHFDPKNFHFTPQAGEITILEKEFIFDPLRQKAMIRLVVSEKDLTQQLWVTISRSSTAWSVAKSQGNPVIPTEGIAQAIQLVAQAAGRAGGCEFLPADEPKKESA